MNFIAFLRLCRKHEIEINTAKYEGGIREGIECDLSISGTFPELGDRLRKFIDELKPYIEDELMGKYIDIFGGSIDLERGKGWLNFKFHARGVNIRMDEEKEVKG